MMKRPPIPIILTIACCLVLAPAAWWVFSTPAGHGQATSVEASPGKIPSADLLQKSGKLSMLRVHDVGTGFGPPADFIDVEVVIRFDGQPGSYGFQLRNDNSRPARQGMLDLLRDAFNNNWTVTINYEIDPPKENGVMIRAWLTK